MKAKLTSILIVVNLTAHIGPVRAQQPVEDPPSVSSRITSIGLFKNGLAVVRREVTLPAEGVYSINPRHELTWMLTLAPGQEQTLEYSYRVLVFF